MNCPKCGLSIPNDSLFCQYCGFSVSNNTVLENLLDNHLGETTPIKNSQKTRYQKKVYGTKAPTNSTLIKSDGNKNTDFSIASIEPSDTIKTHSHYCENCGELLNSKKRKCESCGKVNSHYILLITISIFSLLLIMLGGLNIFQYLHNQKTSDVVTMQKATIDKLEIDQDILQKKAILYDSLHDAVTNNLGFASENFKASEQVIVVRPFQYDRKFTLTAHWSNGGHVSYSYYPSHPSATISLDNEKWNTSTTVSISPSFTSGVTRVEFTNDVDHSSFSILIIVID